MDVETDWTLDLDSVSSDLLEAPITSKSAFQMFRVCSHVTCEACRFCLFRIYLPTRPGSWPECSGTTPPHGTRRRP